MNLAQTILVTGGAGYIGSVLIPKLLQLGYNVRVIDLLLYGKPYNWPESKIEFIYGDFREVDRVIEAVNGVTAVIHLGAIVGDPACQLNPTITIETNLIATRQIAQVAKTLGVKRFIFASTCSVYGYSQQQLTEQSPLNPVSLYARTKIAAEKVLLTMEDEFFTPVILRFATIYGNSFRPRFDLVVNLLAAMAEVEGKITIHGGNQWRPFVHVSDVCNAIIKVLQAPKEVVSGEIFNVGATTENYQISNIGQTIKQVLPNTKIIQSSNITDQRNYLVRFDKIEKSLGFQNTKTVRDGIEEITQAIRLGWIKDYQAPEFNNHQFLQKTLNSSLGQVSPITTSVWYEISELGEPILEPFESFKPVFKSPIPNQRRQS